LSASGTDPRRRYSIKMQRRWKKKINEGLSGAAQNQACVIAHWGWKSSYRSLLPVEGEIFLLTFPFIDQAFTRFD
jgi:hypothetical protein